MTKEQAKTLLPVLTAYSEGKEVQWRHTRPNAEWNTYIEGLGHPAVVGDPREEWRIKPTPRTGRMCLTCQTHFLIHNSEQIHNKHCRKPDVVQWVEVLQ